MCRRIIVGSVILMVLCAVIAAAIVLIPILLGQPVMNTGNAFLQALKTGDYAAAYNMGDPAFQQQSVSPAGLQSRFSGFVPASWNLSSYNIQNDQATVSGSVTLTTNQQGTVKFTLQNMNGTWKITKVDFTLT